MIGIVLVVPSLQKIFLRRAILNISEKSAILKITEKSAILKILLTIFVQLDPIQTWLTGNKVVDDNCYSLSRGCGLMSISNIHQYNGQTVDGCLLYTSDAADE